ncbi:MauE/DoxX family redox-associated membrane protein [Kitasatospora sp. NPDC054939]
MSVVLYLAVGLRLLVGVVFLVASLSKLGPSSHREFRASLRAMGLLPERLVGPAAACVVAVELALVACLAAPARRVVVAGFAGAGLVLLVFAGVIALLLRRGARRPCRCFGGSSAVLAPHHVLRNLLLAAAAGAGAFVTHVAHGPPVWAGVAAAACAGAVVGGLVTVLDEIVSLVRNPVRPAPAPSRPRSPSPPSSSSVERPVRPGI